MCLSGSVATICRVGSTLKQAISVGKSGRMLQNGFIGQLW
jgi:hypothetical protein